MAEKITNLLINGLNPVTVGGTGATLKVFPAVPGSSIGVTSSTYGILLVPGSGRANSQIMEVRACGTYSFSSLSASPTFTPSLLAVINNTPAGNTAAGLQPNVNISQQVNLALAGTSPAVSLVTLGSLTEAGSSEQAQNLLWNLKATMNADTASGLLQGSTTFQIDNGTPTTAAFTTEIGNIIMNAPIPFGLVVGVTFGTSLATNSASLFQFQLEM